MKKVVLGGFRRVQEVRRAEKEERGGGRGHFGHELRFERVPSLDVTSSKFKYSLIFGGDI